MALRKIAVLGAGAIGSSIAADVARAGHDVTVIDQWPAHVDAINARGLTVTMPDGEVHATMKACHLHEVSSLMEPFDLVLMAAKSYDSAWMASMIKPYLTADGSFVGVQNGMNEESHAAIVGGGRVLGCVFELSAELFTPGVVQRNTTHQRTWFGIGEHHGRLTPRLAAVGEILLCAGRVTPTTNIWGGKWSKLINSSMILGPFGILGMRSWEATEIPEVFKLCIRLGRETMAVGAGVGYTIDPIFGMSSDEFMGSNDEIIEKLLRAVLSHHGKDAKKVRGVVLQDFVKGRYTETDHLNGYIAKKGREVGVPTPANDAVTRVAQQIHQGALQPGRSNLAVVEAIIGETAGRAAA
jgi:2-dehydropantoate 2-reductase